MANSASHPSMVGKMSSNALMMGYKGGGRPYCWLALPVAGGQAAIRSLCVQAVGGGLSGLVALMSDKCIRCVYTMSYTN